MRPIVLTGDPENVWTAWCSRDRWAKEGEEKSDNKFHNAASLAKTSPDGNSVLRDVGWGEDHGRVDLQLREEDEW